MSLKEPKGDDTDLKCELVAGLVKMPPELAMPPTLAIPPGANKL